MPRGEGTAGKLARRFQAAAAGKEEPTRRSPARPYRPHRLRLPQQEEGLSSWAYDLSYFTISAYVNIAILLCDNRPRMAGRNVAPQSAPPTVTHPYWNRPVRVAVTWQPAEDELRTASTVELMARYIREDSHDEAVRAAADACVAGISAGSTAERIRREAEAIWRCVKEHVEFVPDSATAELAGYPEDTEALIRPADLIRMPRPRGDCDDFTMLLAAMLRSRGIPVALRTVAADPHHPDVYSHVYVVAYSPDGEIPLDASHGPHPGWEPPAAGKRRTWSIEMPHALGSLGLDWGSLVESWSKATQDILKSRYGHPPAGTFTQIGPSGATYYRQPPDAPPYVFPGGGFQLEPVSLGTLAILIGAVALLFLIARRS